MVSLLGKSDAGIIQGSFPPIPDREAYHSKSIDIFSRQYYLVLNPKSFL
ncbi:MAG: hypothetical protein F6K42_38040 [Leptolyngbya sp. SIO1D8]|nr:hypothetical protein [Leptolyngbya sp. SIO1D8]